MQKKHKIITITEFTGSFPYSKLTLNYKHFLNIQNIKNIKKHYANKHK